MKKCSVILAIMMLAIGLTACTVEATPSDTPDVTPTVAPTAAPELKTDRFLASELIKNADLWNGTRLLGDDYQFLVEYTWPEVKENNLGVTYADLGNEFLHNKYSTGEWGYAYMNLDGIYDGTGKCIITKFSAEPAPDTREEAYEKIIRDITAFYNSTSDAEEGTMKTVMNGHYPWQHYAGEAGFKIIGVETGEGIGQNQFRIAMTRGATKQYGEAWFVDYSQWWGGYLLDYRDVHEGLVPAGAYLESNSETGGHDISNEERTLMLAFMSGADITIVEGGQYMVFYEDKTLTPLGELCQKMNGFTQDYKDQVGTAYTPFGVILSKYHGLGESTGSIVFDFYDLEDYDEFTRDILYNYIWKSDYTQGYDSYQLSNGKYGDTFDVFLQNVSAELLDTYSALIFTGGIEITDEELHKYIDYVNNGGVLVLNTAYVGTFNDAGMKLPTKMSSIEIDGKKIPNSYEEISYGNGSFIVFGNGGMFETIEKDGKKVTAYAGDWKTPGLTAILDELHNRFVPFNFSEEIGYTMTVNDGAIYLMVYNNDGITKGVNKNAEIDMTKTINLDIEYTGGYVIASARDVYNHHDVAVNGQVLSLTLTPGDMAIIELKIGQQ